MRFFRRHDSSGSYGATRSLAIILVVLTVVIGSLPTLHLTTHIQAHPANVAQGEAIRMAPSTNESITQQTHAGLMIEYDDGRIETLCVDTGNPFGTTADQLLLTAQIEVDTFQEYDYLAVCRIGNEGCPAADCFCAFRGDEPESRLWLSYQLAVGAGNVHDRQMSI